MTSSLNVKRTSIEVQ